MKARAQGKVKFFNSEKGYGFIAPTAGGSDVFVHKSALENSGLHALKDGQDVEFDLIEDRMNGKIKADNIKLI